MRRAHVKAAMHNTACRRLPDLHDGAKSLASRVEMHTGLLKVDPTDDAEACLEDAFLGAEEEERPWHRRYGGANPVSLAGRGDDVQDVIGHAFLPLRIDAD